MWNCGNRIIAVVGKVSNLKNCYTILAMNLSCLLSLLKEIPAYRQSVGQLLTNKGEHKIGMLNAAKPYVIAALYEELGSPLMVITAQPENARKLYEQLQVWCPPLANLHRFPEPGFSPHGYLTSSTDTMLERLQTLASLALSEPFTSCHSEGGKRPKNLLFSSFLSSGLRASAHQGRLREESRDPSLALRVTIKQPPLIVASALAVVSKTIPRGDFVSTCHILKQGMIADPLDLLHKWQSIGYEMEDFVAAPGQLSKRGGIIDIFPPCSELPARIEFFGNQIESMRLFDSESQCSVKSTLSITITPAREVFTAKDTGGKKALPSSPFIWQGTYGNILDYLPGEALLIINTPEESKAIIERSNSQAQALREEKIERGELLEASPYFTLEELEAKIKARQYLMLESWDAGQNPEQALPFTPPQSYGGRLVKFPQAAKQMVREKQRIIVVSHQANRLAELLREEDIHISPASQIEEVPPCGSVTVVQGSLVEGWEMKNALTLITDAELFGFVKQARPSKRVPTHISLLLSQLSPGDYVVHIDHGIGRFNGLTRMSNNGIEREYLVLEYASNDRLYVPTEQIERLSRYIGAGNQPPTLSRLGTQEWERTKKRVEQSVADIAQELLNLYAIREITPGFAFSADTLWQQELEASFPYVETLDQLEAIMAVKEDMEKAKPTDRLICGDVGYGKTEVALRAAFKAVMDNKQVAILVPTTILAQQHFTTFNERLQAFPLRVEMLSRFCSPEKEREVLEGLAHGTVDICIGTHRLLQKDVAFKDLGLVIIDEEQRFGVMQKEKLKQMRREVDTLALSATPIPRTLQMSLTGIRDMNIMETPPDERLSIKTYVGVYDEELLRQAIVRELERNGQVFFVHNRIQSIALAASKVQALIPEARIAIAHGQMPEEKLEKVMADFIAGNYDILVATTIVQLGLDMPNVNTLIVDQADKFGLPQLYQLRGRVGRGINQAYAYFFFDKGKQLTPQAHERLRTIFEATELGAGFGIAMRDLEIRGAGNLLGVKQSGHIAAIGFNLYCQLLAEAVEELKAGQTGTKRDEAEFTPSIALPLTAYVPEEYMPNLDARLSLYRRLAKINCSAEIEDIALELKDRFGALPQPVKNLLYITKMKMLASQAEVESIYTQEKQIVLSLARKEGMTNFPTRQEYKDGIKVGTKQIRLDTKRLRNKWPEILENLLKSCATIS